MKLIIKLHSNWAIGSGKAGGSKDSIILKDDNGLPFIPGKTLKGLLRDAFLEYGYPETEAVKLFGQVKDDNIITEKLKDGQLRFNSAYLPETFTELDRNIKNFLFATKTSTRLDDDKQAVEHSLRKNEVAIPVILETNILNKEDNSELSDEDFEKIENAAKMLKLLGEDRHRGLGRTKITVSKKSDKSNSNENISIEIDKKEIHFKCTVTEAMILVKKDKTGQNTASLDYIPGNIFRGIVAGAIANGNPNEFNDIIFNGQVQFGDAHLIIDDKRSHKVPLSFYKDKNSETNKIYNFHELKDKDWTDKKLKQIRTGYLIEENGKYRIKNIAYAERMKSTRSRKDRSAEKSGLFSYHYIKRGQVFEFSVRSDNPDYLKKIIGILNGKTKYFGKSKTAEFGGAVKIEYLKEPVNESKNYTGKYLYAESNLCFLNEYGEFTATPTAEQLTGNSEAEIDWEKSQIRFRTFAPYNFHRRNWDFERLIIEKGSVFVFKNDVEFNKDFIEKGVGCFLTEGYGRVLINPSFLLKKEIDTLDEPKNTSSIIDKVDIKDNDLPVIKIIKNRFNRQMWEIKVDDLAGKTISENQRLTKITKSQWARLFDATTRAETDDELMDIVASKEKQDGRIQSIFYGGINNWNKRDIKIITDYLNNDLIKKDKIFGLRKLAKKVMSKIEKQ